MFTSSLRNVIVILTVTVGCKCYGVSDKITADFGTNHRLHATRSLWTIIVCLSGPSLEKEVKGDPQVA